MAVPLYLDTPNNEKIGTTLTTTGNGIALQVTNAQFGEAIKGTSNWIDGVHGASSNGLGVYGESDNAAGVVGESRADTSDRQVQTAGVFGSSANQPTPERGQNGMNVGVWGDSIIDNGVFGSSVDAPAIFGFSQNHHAALGISETGGTGVLGSLWGPGVIGQTAINDTAGVVGFSESDGVGVWGATASSKWPAVEGRSAGGHGVRGVSVGTTSGANVGVVGFSLFGNGIVGIANSPSSSSFGGVFVGGIVVRGPKSAAVPHPDGTTRLLYCVESPESWFEDFGRAKLVRGKARVKLDKNFATVVRTDDFHVFLSPEDETQGLYVSRREKSAFEVREHGGGTSSGPFSYRVVARRKDVESPRFAKVVLPKINVRELSQVPETLSISKLAKQTKKGRRSQSFKDLRAFARSLRRPRPGSVARDR